MPLTLMQALALAGVASCGFAILLRLTVACGIDLQSAAACSGTVCGGWAWWGLGLAVATLLASLANIGIVAGVASERLRLPFASVGFAAAVPMMPGILMY